MDFYQNGPSLENQFSSDRVLSSYLERNVSSSTMKNVSADLERFGARVIQDILQMGRDVEEHPPVHVPYDAWGRRIDEIKTHASWTELDKVSAEEGIVAIGYERKFAEESRLYQFAKLYLFHPSSGMYSCPLAMTDGAAKLIEVYGDAELKTRAFSKLTQRDPKEFWTSGQWMTERSGGSDVSGTETVAKMIDGKYHLYGVKWFTSATTSQMAMTLARTEDETSGKLSLFYIELRDDAGQLQNISINRLKNKMGTKGLPTAELTLNGTPAKLVGDIGKGVKTISTLFNVTRLYNSCCAVGYMRRGLALATSYAQRRFVFGKKLSEHALHIETLADLHARFELSFHLTFQAVKLLGREEQGVASEREKNVLRLLTPLAKLFTAKEGVSIASEIVESFGGAGYIEDTHLPEILRNAQVLSIWEGTTNVLALDALRAIKKENAGEALVEDLREKLNQLEHLETKKIGEDLLGFLSLIEKDLVKAKAEDSESINASARGLAFNLSRLYGLALLLAHADWELQQKKTSLTLISIARLMEKTLYQKLSSTASRQRENLTLLNL